MVLLPIFEQRTINGKIYHKKIKNKTCDFGSQVFLHIKRFICESSFYKCCAGKLFEELLEEALALGVILFAQRFCKGEEQVLLL